MAARERRARDKLIRLRDLAQQEGRFDTFRKSRGMTRADREREINKAIDELLDSMFGSPKG